MFDSLSEKLKEIIRKTSGNAVITEENMLEAVREIRRALLDADVSLSVVKSFISNIKEKALGADVLKSVKPEQQLVKIVNDELKELLGGENKPLDLTVKPSLILMLGLQGSGKTTSCAKLAKKLKSDGKKPLLVACDVQRPAAITQLKILANETSVDFFDPKDLKDIVEIIKLAKEFALQNNNDILIIDTAGRLQIDTAMMAELLIADRTFLFNEKLLVIDSMTGQEAVDIARNFDEQLNITGVILTKLDGDTRGGAALSVVYSTKKPVKFVGTGEKIEPLEVFYPDRMANRILGMGDIVTLVERAQKAFDEKQAKELEEKMLKNSFSFEDFLRIQKQMKLLGSLDNILGMLPIQGLNNDDRQKISHEGEKQLKKIEVMISSMTKEERKNPDLLNSSRKKRIAKGAGVSLDEFNKFIVQFDLMRKMMKGMGAFKNGKNAASARLNAMKQANSMKRKYKFK
ncbi:MAG: signal recognition particle protein [Candidatus Gastranaerophilales bacterium]|nr:signal recognition particle protein [Candidatus Gastranaerophilales bacterium]